MVQRIRMMVGRNPHRTPACPQWILLSFALPIVSACSVTPSTFTITDYRAFGGSKQYQESFDEGYYDIDPQGNINVVLRSVSESSAGPGHEIAQVVLLRTLWRSVPGETVAAETQLNATVGYYILTGRAGAAYEGAGSVFYKKKNRKPVVTGTLDLASIKPTRSLAIGQELFERGTLRGRFTAVHDPRRVVAIINEMNQRFGPR